MYVCDKHVLTLRASSVDKRPSQQGGRNMNSYPSDIDGDFEENRYCRGEPSNGDYRGVYQRVQDKHVELRDYLFYSATISH
jgi:hypothetical protein